MKRVAAILFYLVGAVVPGRAEEAAQKRIIIADGSTAVGPLVKAVAASFGQSRGVGISINTHGSKVAYQCLADKTCQLGMSSSEPPPGQEAQFDKRQIGWDGLAITTSRDIKIEGLTSQQVKDVFQGKIKNWKDLGGPDLAIKVYQRDALRGARELFDKHFGLKITAPELLGNEQVINYMSHETGAITYMSFGLAHSNHGKALHMLKLDGVEPTPETIRTGKYNVKRPLYLVRLKSTENDRLLTELINTVLDHRAEEFPKYGFIEN